MSTFHVDATQVAAAAATVSTSGSRIRSEVATMMGHLSALNSQWQGSAHASFTDCMTQWQTVQQQVDTALEAISSRLMVASRTYADAETQAQALFTAQ